MISIIYIVINSLFCEVLKTVCYWMKNERKNQFTSWLYALYNLFYYINHNINININYINNNIFILNDFKLSCDPLETLVL